MKNPEDAPGSRSEAEEEPRDAKVMAILQKVANFGDPHVDHSGDLVLSPSEAAEQILEHYQGVVDEIEILPRFVSPDDEEPFLFTDPPRLSK